MTENSEVSLVASSIPERTDINFRKKLFAVATQATIGDDGTLTETQVLKSIFQRPLETEEFAKHLARRFYGKEVNLVVGVDDGAILAHSVARILTDYYANRSVAALSIRQARTGEYGFSFPVTDVLRGANAIVVEPYLSPARWVPIQACLKLIEEAKVNTNVSAIGCVIQCEDAPLGMKNGFRVEALFYPKF